MERKFLASIFSFLPLFLAVYAQSESHVIVPNYDNEDRQIKAYEIKKPLVLHCDVKNKQPGEKLKWYKEDTDITNDPRYKIKPDEDKLMIDKTDVNDDGKYSCEIGTTRKHFNVLAHVVVRTHSNTGVVEGEKLQIICNVVGTAPVLSWVVGNTTYTNSSERYTLKASDNQVENAIFLIENVSLEDRGEYKCEGRNDANEYAGMPVSSDASFVRVKGKFAALWPFLGICAEVLILCLIILIYEKRRNKTELEESDTDPQDQ